MKGILVLCAGMALVASSAFGVGMDLSFGACGDNPGATSDATIDCAGGGSVTLLGVFQPAEAYDDEANGYVLTGFDGIIDINVYGELSSTGSGAFWDWDQFGGCNPNALIPNHAIPAGAACAGYTNPWDVDFSGEGAAAARRTPSFERVAFGCYRPAGTPLITTAARSCSESSCSSTARPASSPAAAPVAAAPSPLPFTGTVAAPPCSAERPPPSSPAARGSATAWESTQAPQCAGSYRRRSARGVS